MTIEQLPLLSPRQRQVMELRLSGFSQATVAAMLKLKRSAIPALEWQAKHRVQTGFIPWTGRGKAKCTFGHTKVPGKACVTCKAEYQKGWYSLRSERVEARTVTPAQQAQREADARDANRRLESRGRCQHVIFRHPCGLLLPCADHDR